MSPNAIGIGNCHQTENTEMELVVSVPPPSMDFNFHSNCSSPYITAPSSPQHFFNRQLNVNTTTTNNNDVNENFEFDFSSHLQRPSLSADELFHGGKVRLLKPTATNNKASSTKTNTAQVAIIADKKDSEILVVRQHPISTKSKWSQNKIHLWRLVTTSSNKSDGYSSIQRDPLEEAQKGTRYPKQKRGRQRNSSSSSSYNNNIKDKCASSLISETAISTATSTYCASFLSSIWYTKGYRKWRLKDFLLIRSASNSERMGTDEDQLRKYSILSKTTACEDVGNCSFRSENTAYEDAGNCSFRSTDQSSGSVSKRRVSAHELHYTVNRAASEELKKKTLLPYKHGLLGYSIKKGQIKKLHFSL